MGLNYSSINKEHYLYIRIDGLYVFNELLMMIEKVKNDCIKNNQHRVLINMMDLDKFNASIIERFNLGEKLASHMNFDIKMGVCGQKEYINFFAETVARNRGMNLRVFYSEEEALRWLLE